MNTIATVDTWYAAFGRNQRTEHAVLGYTADDHVQLDMKGGPLEFSLATGAVRGSTSVVKRYTSTMKLANVSALKAAAARP